ncbi:MAG: guanylate kinase [Planctomycetales bacterium]
MTVSGDRGETQFVVLSGPSGSGKTTIVERLLVSSPVKLVKSVSATTRQPRRNEIDGRDYYFLTPAQFASKREQGEFLECAEVHGTGNWYGTLQSEIARAREEGGWALLEIDVQGARQIMQRFPRAVTIFLRTSSESEYEHRLRGRGTEPEEVIQRRLANARQELTLASEYRFQVVNDDLEQAVQEINHIISSWEANRNA